MFSMCFSKIRPRASSGPSATRFSFPSISVRVMGLLLMGSVSGCFQETSFPMHLDKMVVFEPPKAGTTARP